MEAELRRRSLADFGLAVYPNFQIAQHHRAIIDALEAVERGEIRRLILQIPPRHGKSTLASLLFPPWYLGRAPSRRVIACSYSVDLAYEFSRGARAIIRGEDYGAIFPDVRLAPDVAAVSQWNLVGPRDEPHAGGYVSAGVGGGITGKGADCLPAGTLIETTAGSVAIEHLQLLPVSVKIVCYDTERRRIDYQAQAAFRERQTTRLYRITTTAGRVVEATGEHRFWTERGYTAASRLTPGDALVCVVPSNVRTGSVPVPEGTAPQLHGHVLLSGVQPRSSCRQESPSMRHMWRAGGQEDAQILRGLSPVSIGIDAEEARTTSGAGCHLPDVQSDVYSEVARQRPELLRDVLLEDMCGTRTLAPHGRQGQSKVEARSDAASSTTTLRESVSHDSTAHSGAGRLCVRSLPVHQEVARSPYRQLADEQCGIESRDSVQQAPSEPAPSVGAETVSDTVAMVERLCAPATVYDIQVDKHHNFFANGVLVHNCAIIDDPLKNAEEAASATIRQSIRDWYRSTLYTRLEGEGAVILVMSRWNEDDLAGSLISEQGSGGDRWTVIHLPAVAEEQDALGRNVGEALWPEKFNEADLERIRTVAGSRDFNALYQQRPSPPGGSLFKRDWWQYYSHFDRSQAQQVIQVWDTAFKAKERSDYSVCSTWALARDGAYVLDVFRERIEFPELKRKAIEKFNRWAPHAVLIEDRASGQSLIQDLQRSTRLPIIPVHVDSDKPSRAAAVTPYVEAGRVFLPESAPWVDEWVEEHASFPDGAHDDMVDTTSMALTRLFIAPVIRGNRVAVSAPRPVVASYEVR